MHKLFFIFSLFTALQTTAGTADTTSIYSNAMHKSFNCVIVKPDSYANKKSSFETVYLLHGHGGYYSNWISQVPQLKKYADDYQIIIVCPEGKSASWYFDSPVIDSMQFETYISKEVPAYIDAHYNTIKNKNARAITGLSMGGHGALFLAFRHPDLFSACGSMSGAFIINLIAPDKRYGIQTILGDSSNFQRYLDYNIMKEMENYPKDSLAIIIDCGNEDFIIEMSRMVHKKMLQLKIPHDYIERPGKHEWNYWRKALPYQLLFFRNYFDSKKVIK
ncbi:MAG: alpha/beta hydrolase family protein [Ferruginibacter sp.]